MSFRVAASNIYGTSDPSDLSLAIEFGSVPDKLEDLKSENVDGQYLQATITWDSYDDSIIDYDFQILNKDTNEYVDANYIMDHDTEDGNDDIADDELGRQFD